MPETFFHVRWPDDSLDASYSPSSIIARHLEADRAYSVSAFVEACRGGLCAASDRVRQVYGGAGCSRAMAQLAWIEAKATRFEASALMRVECIGGSLRRSA